MPVRKTRKPEPARTTPAARRAAAKPSEAQAPIGERVKAVLTALERSGSKAGLESMTRFGIPPTKAYGVSMKQIQTVAKRAGRDHDLAVALWETGWYEARMACAFIDEPDRVTAAQMDRWCRDFDNWGIADTVCFVLFDRTPYAWDKVARWSDRREEFEKRAAFALLWGLTVHDKASGDAPFLDGLERIERAAADDRHFVKKAVNMALRATGKRNAALNAAAVKVARRLAASDRPSAKWIGKDALRELTSASVTRRLAT